MPLYTYVLSYGGRLHVVQDSRSNFKGFAGSLLDDHAANSLGGLSDAVRQEAAALLYRVDWHKADGLAAVWRGGFDLRGKPFDVIAIDTKR